MEIIHLVLGKANPNRMNGVNKVAHALATAQKKLGAKVTLWGITSDQSHNYPDRNYHTMLFNKPKNKFSIPKEMEQAIYELPEGVVFHIHGAFITYFYAIVKMLVRLDIPYVYQPHGAFNMAALKRNFLLKFFSEILFPKT